MKKSLLFLGLLGFAGSAQAQAQLGPWTQVNTVLPNSFAPGYRIDDINTVSANVAWAVTRENSTGSPANLFFRTNNAAGTQFDFGPITASGATSTFQTTNISGVSATTAFAANYGTAGGGEILRTTNGGLIWTKVSTPAMFSAAAGGFLDFVHMFNATTGIAVGDPTNNYFEIYRTTDGGTTWTRIPQSSIPAPLTGEAGLTGSYFAQGNTFWFGGASLGTSDQERIFKSTDMGLTWTASPVTPLTESITKIAFKDALNGMAFNVKSTAAGLTAVNAIRSSDGGATWSTITPVNNTTGSFYRYDLDAIDGRYYSSGQRFPSAAANQDFGYSTSTDGINWTNLVSGGAEFFAFDLISGSTSTMPVGYAGLATDAQGVGGIYKTSNVLTTRDAALQSALSVYPNPSTSGVFSVDLGSNLKAGAQLTVVDAMGRMVKTQDLTATAVGSKTLNLDLSGEKTGVYTLQIRSEAGIATQKIVIN